MGTERTTADPSPEPLGVLDRRAPAPARTAAYGTDPAQVYDVRLPRGARRRVGVVVVHGGFWRAEYDRAHAGSQAQAFADAGYPTAVLEYRRTGMPGGGWPGTGEDLAAAVAAVRADPQLPDRLVLVGHSAGGHLAAWAASQPWAHGLAGAVSLAGVVDLRLAADLGLGSGAVDAFMGATPAEAPEAYAAADPAMLRPAVPVVLVHGRDDDTVPLGVSESYLERQRDRADERAEVRLHAVEGCGHFGLIDPDHPGFAEVLAAVALFDS
jgi:acetyl esterase/lipase